MARLALGAAGGARPARGAAPQISVLPSPPASSGRECLVPAAPSPGPEGRAGRAVSYPLLLLPAQVRAAAAPDSRRPRAGAALGVGRGEGLGEPDGERASRRHLAAMPLEGERPRRPLPFLTSTIQLVSRPLTEAGQIISCWAAGKVGCGAVGKESSPQNPASQAPFGSERRIPSLV